MEMCLEEDSETMAVIAVFSEIFLAEILPDIGSCVNTDRFAQSFKAFKKGDMLFFEFFNLTWGQT